MVACLPQMDLIEGIMTHNLFLKNHLRIPRGVGVCSAEHGKKSRFVWDVGGSYGIVSYTQYPMLTCHGSGSEAFWQKWLESLLTLRYSHQAIGLFCVPAALYHCWVPFSRLRHLPGEVWCDCCPNHAPRIRKVMGLKCGIKTSEMRVFFFFN